MDKYTQIPKSQSYAQLTLDKTLTSLVLWIAFRSLLKSVSLSFEHSIKQHNYNVIFVNRRT
jgi:hypothetical protein